LFLAAALLASAPLAADAFGWAVSRGTPAPARADAGKTRVEIHAADQSDEPMELSPGAGVSEGWVRLVVSNGSALDDDQTLLAPVIIRLDLELGMDGPLEDGAGLWRSLVESGALSVSYEPDAPQALGLPLPGFIDGLGREVVWLRADGGLMELEGGDPLYCALAPCASASLTARLRVDNSKYHDFLSAWASLADQPGLLEMAENGATLFYNISLKAEAKAAAFEQNAMEAVLGIDEAAWRNFHVAAAR
jgi:hypothetical protein